jgi:predicted nucleotidyltransferase
MLSDIMPGNFEPLLSKGMEKKYTHLMEQESKALDWFVKELKDYLSDEIVRLELFGSKARGDYGPNSDIDVLLVVRRRTRDILDKIAAIHLTVDLKYNPGISLIILSEKEYEQNQFFETPFVKRIASEGILL